MNISHVVCDDGVRLWTQSFGSGRPLVVLHGGPGFGSSYLIPDLEPLATTVRLVFYDQRNAGRSDGSTTLTAAIFVRDLDAVRRSLAVERIALLGHSWGGLLAGLYAATYPDRVARLVLVGADPPSRLPLWPDIRPLSRLSDRERIELASLTRDWRSDPSACCRRFWQLLKLAYFGDRVRAARMRGDVCEVASTLLDQLESSRIVRTSLGDWDLRPDLAGMDAPAFVVHGTEDPTPVAAAEAWAAALPNANLLRLPGVGHFPHVEDPEAFFPAVARFLANAAGDAPHGGH